jgi:hypothetical protein
MRERGGHTIGDHQQQDRVLRGERHAAAPPAREQHAHDLGVGAHRHDERITDREACDEGIARRRLGGAAIGERPALEERAADHPLARGNGQPAEIVAPEAARGGRHERGALGIEHEEHGAVGVEEPRRPVHHEPEDLGGRQPRGGHGEDFLHAGQGLRIDRQDDVTRGIGLRRRRRVPRLEATNAVAQALEGAPDLGDGLGGRTVAGGRRLVAHRGARGSGALIGVGMGDQRKVAPRVPTTGPADLSPNLLIPFVSGSPHGERKASRVVHARDSVRFSDSWRE